MFVLPDTLIHICLASIFGKSNLSDELASIWRGLQLVWDIGHRFIILEYVSNVALDLIIDVNISNFHPHGTNLSLIRKLASLPWTISFTHTLRGGNECTD